MAGYSGTPLPKKLGIKEDSRIALVAAPADFERKTLGKLPPGVTIKKQARGPLDVIVLFVTKRSVLVKRFGKLAAQLDPAGGLWIAWPKRASGVETDVTEDVLREEMLPSGLVDNKVCAIDDTWSGCRFVWRKENRRG